jgi:hypothetical protein
VITAKLVLDERKFRRLNSLIHAAGFSKRATVKQADKRGRVAHDVVIDAGQVDRCVAAVNNNSLVSRA